VARAFRLNDAPVTIRLKGCLDAGFFVGRQSGRLVVDRSNSLRSGGRPHEEEYLIGIAQNPVQSVERDERSGRGRVHRCSMTLFWAAKNGKLLIVTESSARAMGYRQSGSE
jgi:hypothetical protein